MPVLLTNAEMLAQAQGALHALMTGQSARVVVDQNGERVEFTSVNADRLRAYIVSLMALIEGNPAARGPLNPYF